MKFFCRVICGWLIWFCVWFEVGSGALITLTIAAHRWENLMGGSWSCPLPRATLSCVFYPLSSVFNLLLYSERAILKNAIIARVFYASISFTFWARTCSLTTTWLLASHKLATFAASLFQPWWLHLDGQHNHLRLCNSWLGLAFLQGRPFKITTPGFLFLICL